MARLLPAGVDLAIPKGERPAIIGPNGAGKSTHFNLISGLIAPSAGEIRPDGAPIYKINRRGLSRSFQVNQHLPENDRAGERALRHSVDHSCALGRIMIS